MVLFPASDHVLFKQDRLARMRRQLRQLRRGNGVRVRFAVVPRMDSSCSDQSLGSSN